MDHASGLAFEENYVDPKSDFFLYYAPALNLGYLPGAADLQPGQTEIYGVYDFLTHFVQPDPETPPGMRFDYNSANADVLGWMVSRLMDKSLNDIIRDEVWQKIGAEHDAFIEVDRAYIPVATGGFNATARDAARYGMMIRDKGVFRGERVLPADWLEHMVDVKDSDRNAMNLNPNYSQADWIAYQDMWWILMRQPKSSVRLAFTVRLSTSTEAPIPSWLVLESARCSIDTRPEFPVKLNAARAAANF